MWPIGPIGPMKLMRLADKRLIELIAGDHSQREDHTREKDDRARERGDRRRAAGKGAERESPTDG